MDQKRIKDHKLQDQLVAEVGALQSFFILFPIVFTVILKGEHADDAVASELVEADSLSCVLLCALRCFDCFWEADSVWSLV